MLLIASIWQCFVLNGCKWKVGGVSKMRKKVFAIKYVLPVVAIFVCVGLFYRRISDRGGETEPVRGTDFTAEYLEKLAGKAAPELQKIKGWKNGGPMTLAELRVNMSYLISGDTGAGLACVTFRI